MFLTLVDSKLSKRGDIFFHIKISHNVLVIWRLQIVDN